MSQEISAEELEQISGETNEVDKIYDEIYADMKRHPKKYALIAIKQEYIPAMYLLAAALKGGARLVPRGKSTLFDAGQYISKTVGKPRGLGRKLSRILGVPEERVSNQKSWLPEIMNQFPKCFFNYKPHKIRDLYIIRTPEQPDEVDDGVFALLEPEIAAGAAFGAASTTAVVLNPELRKVTTQYFDVVPLVQEFDRVADRLEKIPSDPVIDWYKSVFNIYTTYLQVSNFRRLFLEEPTVLPHLGWTRFHALVSIPSFLCYFIHSAVVSWKIWSYGFVYETLKHELEDAVKLGIKPVPIEDIKRMFPEPPEDVVQGLRSLSAV